MLVVADDDAGGADARVRPGWAKGSALSLPQRLPIVWFVCVFVLATFFWIGEGWCLGWVGRYNYIRLDGWCWRS